MTIFILEYVEIDTKENAGSFANQQFKYKESCANQQELTMAINSLPDGTKGRHYDGHDWHYFIVGQLSRVIAAAASSEHHES